MNHSIYCRKNRLSYFFFLLFLMPLSAWAEEFVVYYDNSISNWDVVQCYTWSNGGKITEMGKWPGTQSDQVTKEGYYRFVIPSEPSDGIIFNNSHSGGGNQTADLKFVNNGVYNMDGYVGIYTGKRIAEYSETLPVMYITTLGGAQIQKEEYVEGTLRIDALGLEGFNDAGTEEQPLTMSIKGRGNYTWTGFEKKPFKIKLSEKASLLGMEKSKQYVLMAGADDKLGFMRNPVGYELSRSLKLAWTPACKPVELIINGKYWGLYFLTENIKVEKKRVNITEQEDNAVAGSDVTGGWLIEIDNYDDPAQIKMTEGNGELLRFTYHSPEVLSPEQLSYLTTQMSLLNSAIYNKDKSSTEWETLIDKDAAVRFYIVQEIMDDTESYHGSCYFYKDRGTDTKWTWGPVWDFGNAFAMMQNRFIYDGPQFTQYWIGELAKFQSFQQHVRDVWSEFLGNGYKTINDFVSTFADNIADAAVVDAKRWPDYGNKDMQKRKQQMQEKLTWRINWLKTQWGSAAGIEGIDADETSSPKRIYSVDGSKRTTLSKGLNIVVDGRGATRKVLVK